MSVSLIDGVLPHQQSNQAGPVAAGGQSQEVNPSFEAGTTDKEARKSVIIPILATSPLDPETEAYLNSLRKPPEVEEVNGISVIVSGHSLDKQPNITHLEGLSAIKGANFLQDFRQDILDVIKLAQQEEGYDDIHYTAEEVEAGLFPGETIAYETAGPLYGNITSVAPKGVLEEGLLNESIDGAGAKTRERVGKLLELLDVERSLAKHGQDPKLIYSNADDSYILLTVDDPRYDEHRSVRDAVDDIVHDVRNGNTPRELVEDLLNSRGIRV